VTHRLSLSRSVLQGCQRQDQSGRNVARSRGRRCRAAHFGDLAKRRPAGSEPTREIVRPAEFRDHARRCTIAVAHTLSRCFLTRLHRLDTRGPLSELSRAACPHCPWREGNVPAWYVMEARDSSPETGPLSRRRVTYDALAGGIITNDQILSVSAAPYSFP